MPSATPITSLPTFVTPEEHKILVESTPASFNDIPPVLRHKEENISVLLDPPLEGFTAEDGSLGTLYVIESVLVFMGASGRGFQIEYPAITLHAISRAESGPSIYCQLDESSNAVDGEAQEHEFNVEDMRELTIVPRHESALEPIFEALSLCASLHPDPRVDDDMDDDDDAFIDAQEGFGGDGEELSEHGRALLDLWDLESVTDDPSSLTSQVNGINGKELSDGEQSEHSS